MKKYMILLFVCLLPFLYFYESKYFLTEEKAKNIINPMLTTISNYIKVNHKFPIHLKEIESFPYKNLIRKHDEIRCKSCFYYILNTSYTGQTTLHTSMREKFYINIIFEEVKIVTRSCDYFFNTNGTYTGNCYNISGFGINR
jgi:hypothetical protein